MICFALVVWHINHCWLFNARSSLYIYIKYMSCKLFFLLTFLNDPELISCTLLDAFYLYIYIKFI